MSVDFKWVKFTNYGDKMLNGSLYLNPLEYYRGIEKILSGNFDENEERNVAINDYKEGSVASIHPDDLKKFGIEFDDEIKSALVGNVHLLSEDYKYLKVFCLYNLLYDNERKIVIMPSEKIKQFGHKYAIIINDKYEFVRRIIAYLEQTNGKDSIVGFTGDFVRYYNDNEQTKLLGVFNKTTDFEWEHEFRFIFPENKRNLEPIILEIGDISDIAVMVTVEELMTSPQIVFPDYEFVYE